jgi:hypothetical protein
MDPEQEQQTLRRLVRLAGGGGVGGNMECETLWYNLLNEYARSYGYAAAPLRHLVRQLYGKCPSDRSPKAAFSAARPVAGGR